MAKQVTAKAEGAGLYIGTIHARYEKLAAIREPVLSRARECAALTIPALLPPNGSNQSSSLPTPFQGLGARGVNNLTSKMLLALFPAGQPCFRMNVDDFTLEKLAGKDDQRAEVDKALNKIERAGENEVETQALRVPIGSALKFLIVTGNALLYAPPKQGLKVFRLDRYVIKRDPMGNVLEIIVKESISQTQLPEGAKTVTKQGLGIDDNVDLYTRVIRKKQEAGHWMWEVAQEANGEIIPGSQGTYPIDDSPWIPPRWSAVDGEDYGRGLVEEYLGDLYSLEALCRAIVEGSAAAAKVVFMNNPNGTTRTKKLAEAENCSIIEGSANDVTVLQVNKFADFRVALETISKIEQRLSQAFLLMSSITREAERVTAAEVKAQISELEGALGGVYSILAQELQLPLVKRILAQMTERGVLPPLPSDKIKPTISTGIEALGRGNDLSKLKELIDGLKEEIGPEQLAQWLNVPDYISRKGTALGIDMNGLIKTPDQVAAEQQQAQQTQMMAQAAPGAVGQFTKGMMDNMNQRGYDLPQSMMQGAQPNGEESQ